MTKEQLRSILQQREFDPVSYSLDEALPSEKYVVFDKGAGRWSVYYSERGRRTGEKVFDNEDAACRYLLQVLEEDPTTN